MLSVVLVAVAAISALFLIFELRRRARTPRALSIRPRDWSLHRTWDR